MYVCVCVCVCNAALFKSEVKATYIGIFQVKIFVANELIFFH